MLLWLPLPKGVAAAAMAAATTTIIFAIFKRFGLTCPVGRNGSRSKTEAMFFPPPGVKYEDTDLSPIAVDTVKSHLPIISNGWVACWIRSSRQKCH